MSTLRSLEPMIWPTFCSFLSTSICGCSLSYVYEDVYANFV